MISKENCVGCAACENVCSVGALAMKVDEEGFSYPFLDESKCVHCNKCVKVCPVLNHPYDNNKLKAEFYGMKSRDVNTQINSASGGVFPELAKLFLSDSNGFVWGATFDENFYVVHKCIDSKQHLDNLCRSKYVQSNLTGVYKEVKKQLQNGKRVLFTGTPCQTTALKNFIGKNDDNLYLVDIICHGVPSPEVWQEYLTELSEEYSEKKEDICSVCFKYKDGARKWTHPGFLVKWEDGKEYIDFSNNTWYENGFLNNLYVRPSCHICKFKSLSSISDLTIGDFWGMQRTGTRFI